MSPSQNRNFVYVYRDDQSRIRYVGRGTAAARAEHHIAGSHNDGLNRLVASGKYSIEMAGPYRNVEETSNVESALISAMLVSASPLLANKNTGDGRVLHPLGVPQGVADRLRLRPMPLGELGRKTNGALLVRLSSGGSFKRDPGRGKFDPAHPDDAVVSENIRQWWQIGELVDKWEHRPDSAPRVLVGVAGPPRRRYVVGALRLDNTGWRQAIANRRRWSMPVISEAELDTLKLRGRLIEGVRFGQGRHHHFAWVNGKGTVRYMARADHTTVRR